MKLILKNKIDILSYKYKTKKFFAIIFKLCLIEFNKKKERNKQIQ